MAQAASAPRARRAQDFLALTKPTIMLLVLVTGFLTLFLIPDASPSLGTVAATLVGRR
jgi:hypothetical protein